MFQIMQEDSRESVMTIRTRSGMLKGWYFPASATEDVSAMRFHPTPYGDPEYRHFASESLAVEWITGPACPVHGKPVTLAGYETYSPETCPECGGLAVFPCKEVSADFRECHACGRNTEDGSLAYPAV